MIPVHIVTLALLSAPPQQADAAKPAAGACVALVLPMVDGVDGDATSVATSVRSIFQSYLTGPSLKSIELEARLPSQAAEEARQKGCPTLLTVSVSRKATGGGGSKVGAIAAAAGSTAAYIPLPNYGTAVAVGAARSGAAAVESVARGTRTKDEIRMTYKVATADGASVMPQKTEMAKAKSDGEDLLTPMIAKASEAIAGAVIKK